MSEFTPKPVVVAIATLVWLLAAAVGIAMQFDDLPIFVRVIVGALTLLALWIALFASPRVRCAALRFV
jgi:membrane protein YdbS with pleckstrin-like domain